MEAWMKHFLMHRIKDACEDVVDWMLQEQLVITDVSASV